MTFVKCTVLHLSSVQYDICQVYSITFVKCTVLHLSSAQYYICQVYSITFAVVLIFYLKLTLLEKYSTLSYQDQLLAIPNQYS